MIQCCTSGRSCRFLVVGELLRLRLRLIRVHFWSEQCRCLLLLGRLQLPRGRENPRRRVQCRLTSVRGIATTASSDSTDGTANSTKACCPTRRTFGTAAWLGLLIHPASCPVFPCLLYIRLPFFDWQGFPNFGDLFYAVTPHGVVCLQIWMVFV